MKKIIYVRLLNEGTKVLKPVEAIETGSNTFVIGGHDIYDPNDETWEFPPGTVVKVKEQVNNGELLLIAIEK
jgi:hypothetical protein